ncbi:MAG TPA: DUF4838 domain-containing protein [Chryseosolibacter sp.]|nr:DUF4838 domain-containing protein [Chryseosolibacter sp.]
MKRLSLLLFAIFVLATAHSQRLTLVKKGKSKSTIIIPVKATVVEMQAALVFQDYIQRISGARLPIELDNIVSDGGEVLIGNVDRPELKNVPLEKLGADGLFIQNTGKKLVIAGGTDKGALYGVYTFLEKYLGCRKYTAAVTHVPERKSIVLNSINDTQIPAFSYREELYPANARDPEYMAWHKLDSHYGLPDSGNEWGSWVHTFNNLLSVKEYGETHPEYFSYYDSARHPGATPRGSAEAQLCLSNPDVLEIVCKNLQASINQNPKAKYWSVSQNDNVNYCRCTECAALDEKYAAYTPGSILYSTHVNEYYSPLGMGSMMTFINKVAERFPDKIISTLAYQHTRVPPKGIVPRENVNIMLCSIESLRNITLEEGDPAFCKDLIGWTQLTNNIIIWDYVVQFRNLISPFPNIHTLQPNLKYLRNTGVTAMFEQGSPETGGEFHELKAYLIAKLMWNPDLNVSEVVDDFVKGYYGDASPMIRRYMNLLELSMKKSESKLRIFGGPVVQDTVPQKETFLSDSLVAVYNSLFDDAEKAVAKSPELLGRVKTARMPVHYAMLEIARAEMTGKRGAFAVAADNTLKAKPEIINLLYEFVYTCIRTNVSHVRERRVTPQEYLEGYTKFLEENKGMVLGQIKGK